MSKRDLTGKRIGRYEVQKHLGRGGMADVYLGYDVELERPVALKIMLPGMAQDQQFVARFRREARTAARLNHPNIVQVYDVGTTDDGQPYIAMQFIEGGSLRDNLSDLAKRGKLLPTDQALGIIQQVAEGLSVAHAAGIVHRDIKPSNILIREDGRPVVVDLGIAAVQGSQRLTMTGNLIGTPHYMSPEQVRQQPVDGRSDVYSLGVILFELLTGVRPFTAQESVAVLHAHAYEPPPPVQGFRSDLTPQTIHIVETCLAKEPTARYQSSAELASALEQAILAEGSNKKAARTTVMLTQISDSELLSRDQVVKLPTGYEPSPPPPSSGYSYREPTTTPDTTPPAVTARSSGPSWALVGAIGLIATLSVVIVLLMFQVLGTDSSADEPDIASTLTVPTAESGGITVVEITSTPEPATATSEPSPEPTDTLEPTAVPTRDLGPERMQLTQTSQGSAVEVVRFGDGDNAIVLIGGINAGFAPSSVTLAQRAIAHFSDNLDAIPETVTLYIVPSLNPDATISAGELAGRFNANRVDLNRNWDCRWAADPAILGTRIENGGGAAPFSEPETSAMRDFLLDLNPRAVVFWTARAANGWSSPGSCGTRTEVSGELSAVYGFAAGYEVVDYEGETENLINGDASNYLDGVGIPSISVLLPTYTDPDWPPNLAAINALMDFYAGR